MGCEEIFLFLHDKALRKKRVFLRTPAWILRPAGVRDYEHPGFTKNARKPKNHAPLTDGPPRSPLVVVGGFHLVCVGLSGFIFYGRCGHG
jgi:hypothetical protein